MHFEACWAGPPGARETEAVVHLVDSLGELRETPLAWSAVAHRDRMVYMKYDVVLSKAEFATSVARLNEAIRPFTIPR